MRRRCGRRRRRRRKRKSAPARADPRFHVSARRTFPGQGKLGQPDAGPGLLFSGQAALIRASIQASALWEFKDYVACAKPRPHWWGGSHPRSTALKVKGWNEAAGFLEQPVAMARAVVGWKICTLMAFKNGFIGAAGSCTSDDPQSVRLAAAPENSHSNRDHQQESNSRCVTVWDVQEYKGQIAVIALGKQTRGQEHLPECIRGTGTPITLGSSIPVVLRS